MLQKKDLNRNSHKSSKSNNNNLNMLMGKYNNSK